MPRGLSVRPIRGRPKREAPSSSNTIQADEERPRRLGPGPPADPPFPERRRAGRIRTKLHRVRRSTAKSKTPLEAGPRLIVIWYNSDSGGSGGRGRDGDFSPPPAQIPAGAANAPGSHLGW